MENNVETAAKAKTEKKVFFTEERLEMLIAIFLGITALLTAWATWIGSLHGGNQATNYTTSNNIAAEGNSMWNEASQQYMQDLMVWNSIVDYQTELEIAEKEGDDEKAEIIQDKINILIYDSCSDEFADAIEWAFDQEEWASPFDKEGFMDSYYAEAQATLEESQAVLEQGQEDNSNGDRFGLVTVIYSLVLFLLGIVGIFKRLPNRKIVFFVSVAFLLVAFIYMLTIPLPSGFTL